MGDEMVALRRAEALRWLAEHAWTRINVGEYPPGRIAKLLEEGQAGVWLPSDILLGGWKG